MITKKYYKLVKVSYADSDYFRVTNVDTTAGTLTINAGNNLGCNIEYSTDGVNWTTADPNAPFSLTVPSGGNVYMRGDNSSLAYRIIKLDVNHTVGGNVYSLVDKNNYATITTGKRSLSGIFQGNTHLISAADMNFGNVTSLTGTGEYRYMFTGCTSLTKAPASLQITSAASSVAIGNMFDGCASLVTAPEITFTSMSSQQFNNTFKNCSSLNSVKIHIMNWSTGAGSNWLNGVAASGTIYAPTGSDIANYSGASGVPSGWTVVYY